MNSSYDRVPPYLRKYLVEQDYSRYTDREHASWRYIMRQNQNFFHSHAVPSYLSGLRKTGIPIDRIPNIAEMDAALAEFGWGAVAVCGFIPPAAFIDIQSCRILPIAVDMRTAEHIDYTPAPDIVHEAAGHAPILSDRDYAAYLTRYAQLARKAIFAAEDIKVYEAIRLLSDLKENPDMKPADIAAAQASLDAAVRNVRYVSEATRVARMYWWTAEYGLLGDAADPKIYGAGLLSSVGESAGCLSAKVRKIPLSLACTDMPYDITEPQPQLFVARDFEHLNEVLAELEGGMAFTQGGRAGIDEALRAGTVCTVGLDSGTEVSGLVERCEFDSHGRPEFVRFSGPVQLCAQGSQWAGHGTDRHPQGFSAPLGRIKGWDRLPWQLTGQDLGRMGILQGSTLQLKYQGGIEVNGRIASIGCDASRENTLQVLTIDECLMRKGEEILYRPEWGPFDLIFGCAVTSVYGGPADAALYGDHQIGKASSNPGRTSPFSQKELELFRMHRELRAAREGSDLDPAAVATILEELTSSFRDEWLLAVEVLEYVNLRATSAPLAAQWQSLQAMALEHLTGLARRSTESVKKLIADGVRLAQVA